ncbi:MAG TPA: lipoprotein [Sulfuricaulis sp.]|nr:lipoprotein [Sulfuricaulis sp.]
MRRFGSRYIKLLCLVLGIAVLTGCGKKGPLYRPDASAAPDMTGARAVATTATQSGKK